MLLSPYRTKYTAQQTLVVRESTAVYSVTFTRTSQYAAAFFKMSCGLYSLRPLSLRFFGYGDGSRTISDFIRNEFPSGTSSAPVITTAWFIRGRLWYDSNTGRLFINSSTITSSGGAPGISTDFIT